MCTRGLASSVHIVWNMLSHTLHTDTSREPCYSMAIADSKTWQAWDAPDFLSYCYTCTTQLCSSVYSSTNVGVWLSSIVMLESNSVCYKASLGQFNMPWSKRVENAYAAFINKKTGCLVSRDIRWALTFLNPKLHDGHASRSSSTRSWEISISRERSACSHWQEIHQVTSCTPRS